MADGDEELHRLQVERPERADLAEPLRNAAIAVGLGDALEGAAPQEDGHVVGAPAGAAEVEVEEGERLAVQVAVAAVEVAVAEPPLQRVGGERADPPRRRSARSRTYRQSSARRPRTGSMAARGLSSSSWRSIRKRAWALRKSSPAAWIRATARP